MVSLTKSSKAIVILWVMAWGFFQGNFLPAASISLDGVVREDETLLGKSLGMSVLVWRNQSLPLHAVIIAIHGVTLHGGTFDRIASELAKEGYLVVAPDLPGFGRWQAAHNQSAKQAKVSYYQARADLLKLLQCIKSANAGLPIFCLGESLGANLAVWLASVAPDLVSGIVLSSPCITRKFVVNPTLIVDFLKAALNYKRQIPLSPYAKRYLSEDKRVVDAYLNDPLIRKRMSIYESFQSIHANRSCLWFIDQIPVNMPILLVEGGADRMYKADAALQLLAKIPSQDESYCLLDGKGHIQLETPFVSEHVERVLKEWLMDHIHGQADILTDSENTEQSIKYGEQKFLQNAHKIEGAYSKVSASAN